MNGMDSGGSFCTDDSCKLHLLFPVKKDLEPGGPVDCSLSDL